jgi:chromosome segregation ATPase
MSEDTTRKLPDDALSQILARFDSMDARFDSLETRMTALEDKVERRLQDTRPIWEQVLTRLTAIEERLTKVEERLTAVETRLGRVEDEVDNLGRKFRVFNKDILKLQNQDNDLTERMDRIEAERIR